ncbi:MAG: hypothetical protein JO265_16040, partial [Acidimicrobiia bacterium]|nr:hypothetical protein [Acidimicrobiia bacterium]
PPTSNGTFPPPLDGANLTSLRPTSSTSSVAPAGRAGPAPGAQVEGTHLTQANPSSLAATGLSSWLEKAGLTALAAVGLLRLRTRQPEAGEGERRPKAHEGGERVAP